jgi:hypothetical protein
MAFHIVTNRCFLACEKVTSVVIEELVPDRPILRPRKTKKLRKFKSKPTKASAVKEPPKQFVIHITYYPLSTKVGSNNSSYGNSGSSTEECIMDVRIFGQKEAITLYAEIIREVQEQHPSEAYLDRLVDKMLAGAEFKLSEPEPKNADD